MCETVTRIKMCIVCTRQAFVVNRYRFIISRKIAAAAASLSHSYTTKSSIHMCHFNAEPVRNLFIFRCVAS